MNALVPRSNFKDAIRADIYPILMILRILRHDKAPLISSETFPLSKRSQGMVEMKSNKNRKVNKY